MARSAILNVMVEAAFKAARGLTRDFGEVENLQVSLKGPGDFVSAADKQAEKTIASLLRKARPGYAMLLEEGGAIRGEDIQHRWIVDPLDGTTNFLHSNPLFCISIALESQGVIVAGVIYNPITDELFTAERGQGAYLNDRRLRVSGRRDMINCLISTGIPHPGRKNHAEFITQQSNVMIQSGGVRALGTAALSLAYVAAGRYDGYWEAGLSPWDIAAGLLMVREAGGYVTDFDNNDKMFATGDIVAGNDSVHGQLLKLIK
jgi:myo-inositol-1(or 4)-monophosphatase